MNNYLRFCAVLVLLASLHCCGRCDSSSPQPTTAKAGVDASDEKSEPSQASVASTKQFGSESVSKASKALAATDLTKALASVGKKGSFQGSVTDVYVARGNSLVILDFAEDYKTALTAVLFPANYKKFPDLTQLKGKQIVVSGKFTNYEGKGEIILTDSKQIKLLK